jgi:hypothetical protein
MIDGEKMAYGDIPKKRSTTVTAAELQGLKTGSCGHADSQNAAYESIRVTVGTSQGW